MKSLFGRFHYSRLVSGFTLLGTLSAGILIGSVVVNNVRGQESQVNSSDATPLKIPPPRDLATQFTRIAKETAPAVVNIDTEILPKQAQNPHSGPHGLVPLPGQGPDNGNGGGDQGGNQGGFQDFFNRFFGMGPDLNNPDSGQEQESLGSGFIVDPRGYIITNYHVIEKADKIEVRLANDPEGSQGRPAQVVGIDKQTDLAVLKIHTDEPLPIEKMGNSDGAQVGDWVIAIGEPFQLEHTVTAGIISARNRTIGGAANEFQHFLQTDAAINPGNSGGPLIDMAGEVIGVNTAIYTQTDGNEGIGFALPSNTVVNVYNQLIGPEHRVVRGSIGIVFNAYQSSAVARVYGYKAGVMISHVDPGQPAADAGLRAGDAIVSVDGHPIANGDELVSIISSHKPGDKVDIGYVRNGQVMHTTVTIGDWTKVQAAAQANEQQNEGPESQTAPGQAATRLGITVTDLPAGSPAGLHGVLIQSVKPGSFADQIGVGDFQGGVIVAVNRHPVNNVQDFEQIIAGLHSGDDVVFEIVDPQNPSALNNYLGGTLP
ncbi:MAG TPA: trypsin-like peptidase domain-containing protein [Acidobacteriaceae bacterium]|nr:trypsin-like peptidase domain-containing protein [Acidobacteriaceae bacterium]